MFRTSLAASLALLLFCGCSSGDQPTADGEDDYEQDIKSGTSALEDEPCDTKKCTKGLVCAKSDDGKVCKKAPSGACTGKELPACPRACKGDDRAGETCKGSDKCGNAIGDTCHCSGSTWQCTVHAPLGPHCNMVCLP